MQFKRPCLDCGKLTEIGNRCQYHQRIITAKKDELRKPNRTHYKGDYAKRARFVRETTNKCWICGEGARTNDPWTADHYFPGIPDSPLLGAHKSCNSRRGNKPPTD